VRHELLRDWRAKKEPQGTPSGRNAHRSPVADLAEIGLLLPSGKADGTVTLVTSYVDGRGTPPGPLTPPASNKAPRVCAGLLFFHCQQLPARSLGFSGKRDILKSSCCGPLCQQQIRDYRDASSVNCGLENRREHHILSAVSLAWCGAAIVTPKIRKENMKHTILAALLVAAVSLPAGAAFAQTSQGTDGAQNPSSDTNKPANGSHGNNGGNGG
jgi:hypothetical protein